MKTLQPLRWWGTQLGWSVRFITSQVALGVLTVHTHRYKRVIYALLITNVVSVALFGLRLIGAENVRYWFMLWNLVLAWTSPLIAYWLAKRLARSRWRAWQNMLLTIVWLGFLPNSFYMVSDLIHVQYTGEVSIIFDAVMFTSFIFNGFIAGFLSVMILHREMLRRVSALRSFLLITGIFALCGYAIYLGRVLRWNTWDALLHPSGLIFDVSDNIFHPLDHPQSFVVTLSFMLLISSFYLLVWEFFQTLKPHTS
jgi:uncharacterized membrane protein